MRFVRWFRVFRECYQLAGLRGIHACVLFLFGALKLDEYVEKVAELYLGGFRE